MTNTQFDKLYGIETSADVTDATNVDAAGAVMESDFNAATFLYATSNNTPQPKTVSETRVILGLGSSWHYVGELYGGGIVFYVYDNGQHGLIASLDDIDGGSGVQWGLSGTDVPNCESAWDGAANTAAIIAAGGTAGEPAGLCDNYTGGSFTDWYLPASWELNNLYNSAFVISKILESDANGSTNGFQFYPYYWSSTEYNSDGAWFWYFSYGHSNHSDKNSPYRVRAVRAF